METRGRALYNLILMSWQEDQSFPAEDWQVEDYRLANTQELFDRLEEWDLVLDETRFKAYAEEATSPEELSDTLWVHEDSIDFDKAYLIIFELWRRLLPEKQSISVFCDGLDRLIDLYDQDELEDEETLHDAMSDLERILDQHVDLGADPHLIFQEIALYFAHDLESFIIDFVADQIDQEQESYASEILDAFEPYLLDKKWVEFLKMRLLASQDTELGNEALEEILKDQKKEPDLELLLEIAKFLVHRGSIHYFVGVIVELKPMIQTEQDFQQLLAMTAQFYHLLDQGQRAEKMSQMLKNRSSIPLEREITIHDVDVKKFYELVEDLDWSEA